MKRYALEGEIAVVTGAAGKLGPGWVRALLGAGAKVAALCYPGTEKDSRLLPLVGDRCRIFSADVRERTSLESAAAEVSDLFGVPSVLVANAGIDQPPAVRETTRLEDIPCSVVQAIFDVNVTGTFLSAQIFGAPMCRLRRGSIILIGSLYASVSPDARFYAHIPCDPPFLKPPAYGASKAALVNLAKYLATHWAPHGVRVNVLSPGGVEGGQDPEFLRAFSARVPLGRLAKPEELAGPLVFLASESSSYMTGGHLIIDGGYTAW